MKPLLLTIVAIMLSGCISYTNDKGQSCIADADPISAAVSGSFVRCYGVPDENKSED
ncbi:hypothetical protein ACNARK_03855 [Proteus sp. DFP240708]|uniref:hypothetical protein n=1 Tax=Morganellaceae TaxID=1903414 RepID=UPI0012E0823D|nr:MULTISPECIES: hypothetical protein [Morganellaceae]MBI6215813.1 hypothetical protein [Proteus vulgaris]